MMNRPWKLFLVTTASVLLNNITLSLTQTMPSSCSYNDGLYECDYDHLDTNGNIPLSASLFYPIPQRVRMTNLPASLSGTVFAENFANLSISDYDENYPATLELKCSHQLTSNASSLSLSPGFLTNMAHIDDFKIINCHLSDIPADVFTELGSLDRFMIENGSIASLDSGMLNGINIFRNYSEYRPFPITTGEFAIKNTKLSGSLPTELLTGQTDLYSVVLEGMDLSSISSSIFSANTNLRFISLGRNQLAEIPTGLFNGLSRLGEVRLYDTEVSCTCDSLWFMTYAAENYISIQGDIICHNGEHEDTLAKRFFMENCVASATITCDGIMLFGSCMLLIDIIANIFALLSFIGVCIVFGLIISTRNGKKKPKERAWPRRPPPHPGGGAQRRQ